MNGESNRDNKTPPLKPDALVVRSNTLLARGLRLLETPVSSEDPVVARLRKKANEGYAPAQRQLGKRYANGNGVPEDVIQAFYWWEKANANTKGPKGYYRVGMAFLNGDDVEPDYAEALVELEIAASYNFPPAQFEVARLYAQGASGVRQDRVQAYAWMSLAASQSPSKSKTQYAAARDDIGATLTPSQMDEAEKHVRWWLEYWRRHPRRNQRRVRRHKR